MAKWKVAYGEGDSGRRQAQPAITGPRYSTVASYDDGKSCSVYVNESPQPGWDLWRTKMFPSSWPLSRSMPLCLPLPLCSVRTFVLTKVISV